jgi:hypothetical protein
MEVLDIKLERKREDVQCIQVLVPLRRLSLNPDVSGLRRCLAVGYSDEKLPLEEKIFPRAWDINGSKN